MIVLSFGGMIDPFYSRATIRDLRLLNRLRILARRLASIASDNAKPQSETRIPNGVKKYNEMFGFDTGLVQMDFSYVYLYI